MASGIAFRDLSLAYSDQPVLCNLSVDLPDNRITAILGPSGCGKSTMLRLIAGLIKPTSGSIQFLEKEAVTEQLQPGKLAYVFQDPALLPWRSVISNTTLPMELLKIYSKAERVRVATETLEQVGLDSDHWRKTPAELSGGMRMRVSIARALVTDPGVLLLDEPFAALDDMLRSRLGDLVLELWASRPRTIILVTHNIAEAILLSQRIMVMGNGWIADQIDTNLFRTDGVDPRSTSEFSDLYGRVSSSLRAASEEAL